jgi:hypothetical protein
MTYPEECVKAILIIESLLRWFCEVALEAHHYDFYIPANTASTSVPSIQDRLEESMIERTGWIPDKPGYSSRCINDALYL